MTSSVGTLLNPVTQNSLANIIVVKSSLAHDGFLCGVKGEDLAQPVDGRGWYPALCWSASYKKKYFCRAYNTYEINNINKIETEMPQGSVLFPGLLYLFKEKAYKLVTVKTRRKYQSIKTY